MFGRRPDTGEGDRWGARAEGLERCGLGWPHLAAGSPATVVQVAEDLKAVGTLCPACPEVKGTMPCPHESCVGPRTHRARPGLVHHQCCSALYHVRWSRTFKVSSVFIRVLNYFFFNAQ